MAKASSFFPVYLNTTLPPLRLTDMEGNVITENELRSGKFLLHFWATWCKSCEQELFSISGIKTTDIKIMCISIDDEPIDAINFLKNRNLNLNLYFDKAGKMAKILGSHKFPETYIIKNGKIVIKFEGPRNWEDKELINFILREITDP
ncbi:MAG: redoxin domain-containing protein [Deltaproteobacteria bacterium]|nr:redoxin domain-containing protein [Deltaproteobacteria bacterium]